jgi:hypothetical protein
MILLLRRSLSILAACGLVAAVVVYVASFMGTTMDSLFKWAVFLHVGVFVLLLPMHAVEYSSIRNSKFFWDAFSKGLPKWTVRSIQLLGLFFAVHFVLFLVQSHAASPEIKNGEYVLNNHGQIVRVLTESEYRWLKGSELRLFATGWMFFYFVPTMYWWFPKRTGGP